MSYQQAAERRLKKKKMLSTNQKIMTQITRTKNLKYYLLHVFHNILILKYLFASLFSFSYYNMLKARIFRNNAIPLEIYLVKKITSHLQ